MRAPVHISLIIHVVTLVLKKLGFVVVILYREIDVKWSSKITLLSCGFIR